MERKQNLSISLNTIQDKFGNNFVANKLPTFSLDLRQGYAFFVFLSEEGMEELQIAPLDLDAGNLSQISKQTENMLKFKIYSRQDQDKKTYFLGKIKMNATLTLPHDHSSFMVFTSIPGGEELQIKGELILHS